MNPTRGSVHPHEPSSPVERVQIRLFIAMLGYGVALAFGYGLLTTTLRSDVAAQWLALSLTVAVYELGVCWRALRHHVRRG